MSFVIRYFEDSEIREEFLGFKVADELDAESLAQYILQELEDNGLEVQNLVGQGYDGASVMSGRCSGVQERIWRIVPQAIYVHCFAHRLNLVIVDSVKSIILVADFFSTLQTCYNFLSGSNVHAQWIAFQKREDMFPKEKPIEFKTMSNTRWACQVHAVSAILSRFDCFVKFLQHVELSDSNRDRALNARSILAQLDQTFTYCILLMNDTLQEAKGASDLLQSSKLDYMKAAGLIESLIGELQTNRCDEYFECSCDIAVILYFFILYLYLNKSFYILMFFCNLK